MRKTHIVVLTVVAVAIVLAVGAAGAYGDLASDTTAPTTTTDAAASYWNDAVVTLTASDDEGIAYIYHELDNGIARLTKVEGSPLSASVEAPLSFTGAHKNPGVGAHTLKYWAQDVNGNVEAQHTVSFTVAEDAAKPETTATGALDGAWHKAAVLVTLTAADAASGSGVKELSYTLDGASAVVVQGAAADVTVPAVAGLHTVVYHATDVAGNAEDAKTLTVNVDLSKPVTTASAVSAIKGRKATLRFRVTETGPNAGQATVVIKVRNKARRVVATVKPAGLVTVNSAATAKFTCKLAKGTYTYTVYATDVAGNTQAKAGSARLTVR